MRFNTQKDHQIQLDNYLIKTHSGKSKYAEIDWIDIDLKDKNLRYPTSAFEKMKVAKYLCTLSYEVNPNKLNMHNYEMLVKYLSRNEQYSHRFSNLIREERSRINKLLDLKN